MSSISPSQRSVGQELISILKEKAQQGVEVSCSMTALAAGYLCTALFRELRQAGGRIQGIRPWARALNYRNHHKLVIIDRCVGYLGGMNVGEHYAEGARHGVADTTCASQVGW